MTLKNARRRLEDMGYEVERDEAPYKYKIRRVGTLRWTRGFCLDVLIIAAKGYNDARV